MTSRLCLLATFASLLLTALGAEAQPAPRPGSLRLTVRDGTNLRVAGAQVVLHQPDGTEQTARTNDSGIVAFDELPAGAYGLTVTSPGFAPFTASGIQMRAGGRINREVELQIGGIAERIDVAPSEDDRQLMDAFTTRLSAEAIANLPDDPDELAALLEQLAGSDADIRVDGFSGGDLPPGTRIREVRVRWDGASANSSSGGPTIEIATDAGGDRWHSTAGFNLRDDDLNARQAYSRERPSGQTRQYSWWAGGPLVSNRTGVSFSIDRSETIDQQAIRAATPEGIFSALVNQPSEGFGLWGELDHAFTPAQRLHVEVTAGRNSGQNQGLGELDLPEHAFASRSASGQVRASHESTLHQKMVNRLRAQTSWRSSSSIAASEAPAIRVLDAFTRGGAQVRGGRRSRDFEIEDELEFGGVPSHQMSAGVSVNGSIERGDEWRNATGTFTFASPEAFAIGQATTFTQRVGDPFYRQSSYRFSWYVADSYRAGRSVMVNVGLRQQAQTHLSNWANFAPRVGVNWSPSSRLRTMIRASLGLSYQFLDQSVYEQTRRVDGRLQHDIVIVRPAFPDVSLGGTLQTPGAPSIIRARPDLIMPSIRRFTAGVDQPLTSVARVRVAYSRQDGRNLFRSRNANAPLDGVRQNPAFANITELESTATSFTQSLEIGFTFSYEPWKLSSSTTYRLGESWNETDGSLTLPPDSVDLADEWGPSRQDVRHRLNVSVNSDLWTGLRIGANVRAQSAPPYTITTGLDTNGDGVNNERPEGVRRNSARGAAARNLDLSLTWGVNVGSREPVVLQEGSAEQAQPTRSSRRRNPDTSLARIEIFARASNVLNIVNRQRFSGVLQSPFFGQATSADDARRIVLGTRVSF